MTNSDPQSVADVALGGHADAALREWLDNRQAEIERDHRDGWTGRTCYCDSPKPCADRAYELAMVEGLRALLADRKRMAAELEQVRGDADEFRARRDNAVAQGDAFEAEARELAQALITAHAKNKRLLDRATAAETELEQVRGDLARARDDSSEVWLAERGEEMRDALTVAVELIDRLASKDQCRHSDGGYCWWHAGRHMLPCPHPLGRRFVEAWRAVQADATERSDAEGAGRGPESHGDATDGAPR